MIQMQTGSGRIPGDFGFDPLGFSKVCERERETAWHTSRIPERGWRAHVPYPYYS